jgi:hypothetical protein
MKTLITLLPALLLGSAFAADVPAPPPASAVKPSVHRFIVERTFPPGALKGLDAATKKKVNANNASVGVRWVHGYGGAGDAVTEIGGARAVGRTGVSHSGLPVCRCAIAMALARDCAPCCLSGVRIVNA